MTLSQLFRIIWARKGQLALVIVLGLVASSGLLLLPKQYEATATLVVDYVNNDPVSNISPPPTLMDAYMSTQTSIARSYRVARTVVDDLHLTTQPQLWQKLNLKPKGRGLLAEELALGLIQHVRTETPAQSEILTIGYEAQTPQWAAATANAFVRAYLRIHKALKDEPLGEAEQSIDQYLKSMQAKMNTQANGASGAYDEARSRYVQIGLKRISTHSNISVLNSAIEPQTAFAPKILQTTLLILSGCLIGGVCLVFGLEMRRRRVRAAEDLTDELNLRVLAIVD